MKGVAPACLLHTLALLWHVLARRGRAAGLVAMLLLLATPLYYGMVRVCHTDPLRVYAFVVIFV